MGLSAVTKQQETIEKALKRAKDQKAGKPVKYQDFLTEPVSKKTRAKYRAAVKMGNIEAKLDKEGLPKRKNYLEKTRSKLRKSKSKSGLGKQIFKKSTPPTQASTGGKVYKVDNSGQMMVQRMYGGKIKK